MSGLLASAMAMLAGMLFGLNVHIQRRGLAGTDPLTGSLFSVAAMAVLFWCVAPFLVDLSWWLTTPAAFFAIGGLLIPGVGQGMQIYSIRRVGPSLTAAIGAFAPLFAAIPAVLFLGERLGVQGICAMALMITGLMLAAWSPRGVARGWPVWALSLPLVASMARGGAQPVTKAGLTLGANPIFAALVMASVSTLTIGLIVLARRGLGGGGKPVGRGGRWFALSGVLNGVGILFLNIAISLGDVTLVAPLVSTAPLWAVAFAGLGMGPERPRPRHGVVAVMVVLGAVMLITR